MNHVSLEGDRTFKLGLGATPEYGRYVESSRGGHTDKEIVPVENPIMRDRIDASKVDWKFENPLDG